MTWSPETEVQILWTKLESLSFASSLVPTFSIKPLNLSGKILPRSSTSFCFSLSLALFLLSQSPPQFSVFLFISLSLFSLYHLSTLTTLLFCWFFFSQDSPHRSPSVQQLILFFFNSSLLLRLLKVIFLRISYFPFGKPPTFIIFKTHFSHVSFFYHWFFFKAQLFHAVSVPMMPLKFPWCGYPPFIFSSWQPSCFLPKWFGFIFRKSHLFPLFSFHVTPVCVEISMLKNLIKKNPKNMS